ncbi:MAG: 2-dehydropantoate 2-reductase [bacterium]|nr:2-dehydropantoate 2-reductase [bacterium]
MDVKDRSLSVGVVGGGAMGTLFAWMLAPVAEVTIIDVRPAQVAALAAGVREEHGEPRTVRATLRPQDCYHCDILFVFVKAHDTLNAMRPFAGKLDPACVVVSLQNGLGNEEAMKTALGGQLALVLGVTAEGSTELEPGRVRRAGAGTTVLGGAGASPETVAAVRDLLSRAGLSAQSVYDIRPQIWGKLVANAAINPVTAILDAPNGVLLDDEDAQDLGRLLAAETVRVAEALRVSLPFQDAWEYVRHVASASAGNLSSMLADLRAGRRTEIEAINGAIAALGRRHGIAVPCNEVVTHLVRARERTRAAQRGGATPP